MQGTYTSWLVCLSIAVAIVVSYTALSLASRVSNARAGGGTAWLIGGAAVLGVGIWSMHFIGMLALSLPISLSYSLPVTAASLAIAIGISAFALVTVSRATLDMKRLVVGALVMGAGIAAMHYCGMAGIRIVPGITYDPWLFTASVLIAVTASFAALWLAFKLRRGRSWQMVVARIGAATLMGLAISGMHYTGMAASQFGAGVLLPARIQSSEQWFAILLSIFALGVMAIAILTVVYDSWMQQHRHERDEAIDGSSAQCQSQRHADRPAESRGAGGSSRGGHLRATRKDGQLALLVLNVDRLKSINDSLGHQAGDEMLLELSRRLSSVLRHNDTLARLAGDEFTILATELRGARDAEAIADKVLEALQQKFTFAGVDVHPSVSIGISTFPLDGETFDVAAAPRERSNALHQGRGARQLSLLCDGDEQLHRRSTDAGRRIAARARERRAGAALPAEGRHRHQSRAQR